MDEAVISGDIIASTSLSDKGRGKVESHLRELLKNLEATYQVFGRIIKGDYLECYVPQLKDALRVTLVIKSYIKSITVLPEDLNPRDKRGKLFKIHGIRLAIGIGKLTRLDLDKGIIDGEAIYNSGRIISENQTFNKEKISIKNTLYIKSGDIALEQEIEPLLALLDVLMTRCTSKQSEVIYMKLMGNNEESIAKRMGILQPTVNQHSTSAGWNAIEKAVLRFETVIKNKK